MAKFVLSLMKLEFLWLKLAMTSFIGVQKFHEYLWGQQYGQTITC